jgi:gamma-glutamylcyclotransferase (GGCT)/AIG2-like uncharacterized protein YtfP
MIGESTVRIPIGIAKPGGRDEDIALAGYTNLPRAGCMEPEQTAPLRIFVYGSLKRGYRNHTAYCQGYETFRTATVVGRLYRQADGYPMLVVPPESILAIGTSDIRCDLEQLALVYESESQPVADDPWQEIRGEIYQWPASQAESSDVLARLDRLEDFYPSDVNRSLYHRVIVLAQHAEGVEPVWTFVAPQGELPHGCSPMGRSWP